MSEIEGVQIVPLRRIPDERGTIYHMLKATDPHFQEFGEIYFSSIYRDVVKGWHRHDLMTLNYCCIFGRVKVVVHDDREGSDTRGATQEIFIGEDNHSLVVIPPNIWNGFKGMSDRSIVANCATHPHDPTGSHRLDPYENDIPYDWGRIDQ